MKALLLAGGFGTRLRPITNTIPKCLVTIAGVPLMDYWLNLLLENGIEEILINTHYLPEQVETHIATSKWRGRITLVHEEELLGTGGTVLKNKDFFDNESFMVVHADNLTWFDVKKFIASHENRPSADTIAISMMTFDTDSPKTCGIVEEDERGVVVVFHEKVESPPSNKANGAIYIFEPSVVSFLQELGTKVIDLSTELLPHFLGRITTFHNQNYLRDIGSIESLEKAEADILNGKYHNDL